MQLQRPSSACPAQSGADAQTFTHRPCLGEQRPFEARKHALCVTLTLLRRITLEQEPCLGETAKQAMPFTCENGRYPIFRKPKNSPKPRRCARKLGKRLRTGRISPKAGQCSPEQPRNMQRCRPHRARLCPASPTHAHRTFLGTTLQQPRKPQLHPETFSRKQGTPATSFSTGSRLGPPRTRRHVTELLLVRHIHQIRRRRVGRRPLRQAVM